MDIEVYVCETAEGLIRTRRSIAPKTTIAYATEREDGETGDLTLCGVAARKSAAKVLASYAGKFVLVAIRE